MENSPSLVIGTKSSTAIYTDNPLFIRYNKIKKEIKIIEEEIYKLHDDIFEFSVNPKHKKNIFVKAFKHNCERVDQLEILLDSLIGAKRRIEKQLKAEGQILGETDPTANNTNK